MKQCQGCGVWKDPAVLELYTGDDLHNKDPIVPLIEGIPCQSNDIGSDGFYTFRVVTVCHSCFHRLEPDMWISENCWLSLNPYVPFADLLLEE